VGGFLGGGKASAGWFGNWGGFARWGKWGVKYPRGPSSDGHALGFFGGAGVNLWLTNADRAEELAGPSNVINLNVGMGKRVLSLQYAMGDGIWMASVGFPPLPGYGVGAATSVYDTETAAGTRASRTIPCWLQRLWNWITGR
jgi:hypothetical protein